MERIDFSWQFGGGPSQASFTPPPPPNKNIPLDPTLSILLKNIALDPPLKLKGQIKNMGTESGVGGEGPSQEISGGHPSRDYNILVLFFLTRIKNLHFPTFSI